MTWIVIANSNCCFIYDYDKKAEEFVLIKEISDPVVRMKASEYLTSDKPGHYKTGSAHGAYEQHTSPKKAEVEHFAHEICAVLNEGRNANAYGQLIIVANPHIQGLLSNTMDKHVKALVTEHIEKDVAGLPEHERIMFVQAQLHKKHL